MNQVISAFKLGLISGYIIRYRFVLSQEQREREHRERMLAEQRERERIMAEQRERERERMAIEMRERVLQVFRILLKPGLWIRIRIRI
jgi:hypothetical protein